MEGSVGERETEGREMKGNERKKLTLNAKKEIDEK